MWAAKGRPDGNLGQETITLEPGQKRVFITDAKEAAHDRRDDPGPIR
ncbi:hypothetical protein BH24CHL8_BH24CHL8_10290 [soil metagenome]